MNNGIRAVCGMLGIILTAISIIASSGYILNESNRVQNKSIQSSATYKQLEHGKEIQTSLFKTKNEEIERLKGLQTQQRQDGQKAVDGLPKDYISKKSELRQSTQNKISGTQQQIDKLQSEISGLSAELQKPIDTKNVNFKAENGYIALFQLLADKLNNLESFRDSPTTADRLLTYFLMFISAVFEILAVVLYIIDKKILSAIAFVISFAFTCFLMVSMAFGVIACVLAGLMAFVMDFSKVVMLKIAFDGNVNSLSPTPPKNKIKVPEFNGSKNDNLREIKSGRLKGFKFKKKQQTFPNRTIQPFKFEEELKIYMNYIRKNPKKNGAVASNNDIIKNTGMNRNIANEVRKEAKKRKLLNVKNTKTKLQNVINFSQ